MKITLPSPEIKFPKSTQVVALRNFCNQKRLTDCLEMLEQNGIQGDEAIFILSNLSQ